MPYKTIIIELLRQRPRLHGRLRRERRVLAYMNHFARELKMRHEHWKAILLKSQAGVDSSQISGAAMEIALEEVKPRLRNVSLPDDQAPSSSDDKRARSRKRTSRA